MGHVRQRRVRLPLASPPLVHAQGAGHLLLGQAPSAGSQLLECTSQFPSPHRWSFLSSRGGVRPRFFRAHSMVTTPFRPLAMELPLNLPPVFHRGSKNGVPASLPPARNRGRRTSSKKQNIRQVIRMPKILTSVAPTFDKITGKEWRPPPLRGAVLRTILGRSIRMLPLFICGFI